VNNTLQGSALGRISEAGGAGINLSNARFLFIAGNRIKGFNDDAIALISSENCVIQGNWAKGIESRIAVYSGKHNAVIGNYLERQPGADGVWPLATTFYTTALADLSNIPSTSPRPEDVKFIGNTAVLPANAPPASEVDFLLIGAVDGCLAHGNTFINNSSARRARIRLLQLGTDSDGRLSVPGAVQIANNIMSGENPGTIEEDQNIQTLPAGHVVGPLIYAGNIASDYEINHPNSFMVSALTPDGSCVNSNQTA